MTGRCTRHDLAAGPDGRCVLCRREAGEAPAAPGRASGMPWTALLVGALVLFGGGLALAAYLPGWLVAAAPEPAEPGLAPEPLVAEPAVAATDEEEPPAPSWERPLSRAEKLRDAIERTPITLYATDWCPSCRQAEAHLDAIGARYDRRNVDNDAAAAEEYARLNPRRTIPTLAIGREVVVGFSPQGIEAALLRSAGY